MSRGVSGPDFLAGPARYREFLDDNCPDFMAAASAAGDVLLFAEECATRADVSARTNEAFGSILNQILNDWVELLQACVSGMGRSALRSARSIFELALFAGDLFDNDEMADRYLDHDIVIQHELAKHDKLHGLMGKALKSARHHRDKQLRDLHEPVEALVGKYGRQYRRSWSPESVHGRAEREGQLDEYVKYRHASGVAHGAVFGRDGTMLRYDAVAGEGTDLVYRLGGNFYLCAHGFEYGFNSFARFVGSMKDRGIGSAEAVLHRLDRLGALHRVYYDAMWNLHIGVSPSLAPARHNVVALLHPSGTHDLYLHDPEQSRMIRAMSMRPDRTLKSITTHLNRAGPAQVDQSVLLLRDSAKPVPGADWEPDESLRCEYFPLSPTPGLGIVGDNIALLIGDDGLPRRLY